MKLKTLLIIGLAGVAGYVLGSRAGRAPYEELAEGAKKAWNSPEVKKAVREAKRDLKRAGRKITR